MPLKFKLYYACAMYLLLWASLFFMWMFYQSAIHGMGSEIGIILTAFLIVALNIVTGVTGIRAIKHYKQASSLSKTERAVFIAMYCFNILFAIGVSLLLGLVIIPEMFRRRDYFDYIPRLNIEDLALSTGLLFAGIASIYLAVTGLFLLKAIRLKQRENLLSFEIKITPEN